MDFRAKFPQFVAPVFSLAYREELLYSDLGNRGGR